MRVPSGGAKLGEFFERLHQNGIPWPSEWEQRPGDEYPEVGQPIRDIPERDRKYVRVKVELNCRRPVPDSEREPDKLDVLREIKAKLG